MKEAAGKRLASYLFTNGFENCLYANGFVGQGFSSVSENEKNCQGLSLKPHLMQPKVFFK